MASGSPFEGGPNIWPAGRRWALSAIVGRGAGGRGAGAGTRGRGAGSGAGAGGTGEPEERGRDKGTEPRVYGHICSV